MRIDEKLVTMLTAIPGLWFATHFNHPRELTTEAISACSKLIKNGIPVVNQTVLLKGINDNSDILADLFQNLVINKIKPHYLFHIDPVQGNAHFATGIDVGLKIIKELRNKISSLATPVFAIDLPEGGGKIPLLPNYKTENGYEAIDGNYINYP
jgi:lysine 2,3-aminomutase